MKQQNIADEDLKEIGIALMKKLPESYSWSESPVEYITGLENTIYELSQSIIGFWVTSTWMPGEMPKKIRSECVFCTAEVPLEGECVHHEWCIVPKAIGMIKRCSVR